VITTVGDWLDRALTAVPGGPVSVVLLALLLVGLLALVLYRTGPLARRDRDRQPLFAGSPALSAQGHRELAEAAAREGRWADAVRERLRAVVRDLESRGALDPRPGRTAGEVARDGRGGPCRPWPRTSAGGGAVRRGLVRGVAQRTPARTPCWSAGDERVRDSRLVVTGTPP
jgi:hypothetical protein